MKSFNQRLLRIERITAKAITTTATITFENETTLTLLTLMANPETPGGVPADAR